MGQHAIGVAGEQRQQVEFFRRETKQAGQLKEAIELFKLNVEAYPTSANVYDSLGDGYVADGQNDLARQASQKALELLPASPLPDAVKAGIRESAEQKLNKLK